MLWYDWQIRERVERDNCNIQKKVDKDYARKEEQLKNVIPPSGWKDTPKATGEEDHVQYARGPLHVERHRHVERNKHRFVSTYNPMDCFKIIVLGSTLGGGSDRACKSFFLYPFATTRIKNDQGLP